MKTILLHGKLSKGTIYALITDEDYDKVSKYKWYYAAGPRNRNGYAMTFVENDKDKLARLSMHRFIMKAHTSKSIVDHINRNTLDNRRENLRFCTNSQNNMNSLKRKNCSSSYKGVTWSKRSKQWVTELKLNGQRIYLGYFKTEEHAAMAYDIWAFELFGAFAHTNFERAV